jgi:TIR domain
MEGVKIEVFILFDKEDRDLFLELKKHLASLEKEGLIVIRDEEQIVGGTNWRQAMDHYLQNAPFVLLLISSHFMASESYTLAKQAFARRTHPKESVVPVLLHAVDWEHSDFGSRKPLPANREPISSWPNRHAAFFDVVRGVRDVIKKRRQSIPQKVELVSTSLVTVTTPDSKQYTTEMPGDVPVGQLLRHILSQWLPLTLGTIGSRQFSLRPISLDREGTLHEASLVFATKLELVSEALAPSELINVRLEDNEGKGYTKSVLLNTVVGQLADGFLGTTSGTGEAVVEWMLSTTSVKQLRLEASLYYQGVCDDALLRMYRLATAAEE